ncbi:hypothetical protein GALMADRAFT_160726 [Galerina marginata CBS 339.88]|uniref:Cytochrome P450 n=1 Tax=Galerina marginata (strain CBS 339.88) TaxID=685588 RepID=A0A067SMQ4_GALM3|nr:hypothetical protein GALMADRAFT_160726 [Galerina marginata CBS 339.88]
MFSLLTTVGCLLAAYWVYSVRSALRVVQNVPGYRPLFSPFTLLGAMLPMTWWNLSSTWSWKLRKTAYFNYSHDVISVVPLIRGPPSYHTCSLDVAQQLLGSEGQRLLPKPRDPIGALVLWGENIFSSEGEIWKRHRRIMAPAFSTKTYAKVLEQTKELYREMVQEEGWEGKVEVVVDSIHRLTMRVAFLVIARCGFGMPIAWTVDEEEDLDEAGTSHALTFVAQTTILRLVVPNWMYRLPIKKPAFRRMDRIWKSLSAFMHKSVEARAQEVAAEPELSNIRGDVFTRLIAAHDRDGKYSLNADEVIGNTFVLMFAGHETTASVLTTALTYLAIHQGEQAKAYEEIISIIPHGHDPTLDDLSQLRHTLACFNESLRLVPAAPMLTREMPEDIVIRAKRPFETTMVLKKGTLVVLDIVAICRNPHIFSEPDKFMPSRWYGISEHDVTMFGIGSRACIGRKFTHTEALTFLALLLRDWQVDVVLGNETREQYEERVMSKGGIIGFTFGVTEPIKLGLQKRVY